MRHPATHCMLSNYMINPPPVLGSQRVSYCTLLTAPKGWTAGACMRAMRAVIGLPTKRFAQADEQVLQLHASTLLPYGRSSTAFTGAIKSVPLTDCPQRLTASPTMRTSSRKGLPEAQRLTHPLTRSVLQSPGTLTSPRACPGAVSPGPSSTAGAQRHPDPQQLDPARSVRVSMPLPSPPHAHGWRAETSNQSLSTRPRKDLQGSASPSCTASRPTHAAPALVTLRSTGVPGLGSGHAPHATRSSMSQAMHLCTTICMNAGKLPGAAPEWAPLSCGPTPGP